jgi:hypothetical protein
MGSQNHIRPFLISFVGLLELLLPGTCFLKTLIQTTIQRFLWTMWKSLLVLIQTKTGSRILPTDLHVSISHFAIQEKSCRKYLF